MSTIIDNRVYLAVPFDEKDEAKKYGARWDPDRRLWWIDHRNISLFPGIHRWIVGTPRLRADAKAEAKRLRQAARPPKAGRMPLSTSVTTAQTTFLLPSCDCQNAPWDTCEHTVTLGFTTVAGRPEGSGHVQHEAPIDPMPS